MTQKLDSRIKELCGLIIREENSDALLDLITKLNQHLAPRVSAYSVNASRLDVNRKLSPGTYDTIVQASDNCGGVGSAPVSITVSATGLQPAASFI